MPFALSGLVSGKLVDRVNRKYLLSAVLIMSSLTFGIAGGVNSFIIFALMRAIQAALSSAVSPLAYSIINDTIPEERRSSANSLISSCFNLGEGLSSLSILIISMFGWRSLYGSISIVGMLIGVNILALLKEP